MKRWSIVVGLVVGMALVRVPRVQAEISHVLLYIAYSSNYVNLGTGWDSVTVVDHDDSDHTVDVLLYDKETGLSHIVQLATKEYRNCRDAGTCL